MLKKTYTCEYPPFKSNRKHKIHLPTNEIHVQYLYMIQKAESQTGIDPTHNRLYKNYAQKVHTNMVMVHALTEHTSRAKTLLW